MSKLSLLVAGATLALATAGAFAQGTATPRVDQREANQQARIQQGVGSGQLTAHETQRLEKEQVHVARVEARAKSDGTVTPAERRKLKKAQNHASADIYRQKHDAQVAKP